jgi:hypothetical protein
MIQVRFLSLYSNVQRPVPSLRQRNWMVHGWFQPQITLFHRGDALSRVSMKEDKRSRTRRDGLRLSAVCVNMRSTGSASVGVEGSDAPLSG